MGKWEMVRLGDVCDIVSGTTPSTSKPELWDGDVKWIAPAEISDDSYFIYDTVKHISPKSGLKLMPIGTVLLSSRAPIGKVAITGSEMCCNQGFKNLICSKKVHNRYLYRYLKNKTEYLNSLGRGATFKEISKSIVEQIEIPLPPLPVQQQIADVLDHASALIAKRKAQIEKLDLLVKSQFMEMFGDPVTNPKGWEKVPVGDCLSDIIAGWSVDGEARNRRDNEIAVLKVSAVTRGVFDPNEYKVLDKETTIKKRITPEKGDVLFSRANTRELLGATCIVNEDFPFLLLSDKLWKLKCNQSISIYYLKYALSQKATRNELSTNATGTSGSMYNVSMEKLRSVSISLPSIKLQNEFADFVQQAEAQKERLKKCLAKLEVNYKSLMQKCFRGEIF